MGLPRTQSTPDVARNLGAQMARGKIVFVLDADVLVPPETMAHIAAGFRCEPTLYPLCGPKGQLRWDQR